LLAHPLTPCLLAFSVGRAAQTQSEENDRVGKARGQRRWKEAEVKPEV